MARRPRPPDEVLTRKDLAELQRGLSMMSQTAVQDFYRSAHMVCRIGLLAAHTSGCSFSVLTDARRPELIEDWYAVIKCVRPIDLRLRCKVLTWQELAQALPRCLRVFLSQKYGITEVVDRAES